MCNLIGYFKGALKINLHCGTYNSRLRLSLPPIVAHPDPTLTRGVTYSGEARSEGSIATENQDQVTAALESSHFGPRLEQRREGPRGRENTWDDGRKTRCGR